MGGQPFLLSQAPGLSSAELLGPRVSLNVALGVEVVTESTENLRALNCSASNVVRVPPALDHGLSCHLCEITYFELGDRCPETQRSLEQSWSLWSVLLVL